MSELKKEIETLLRATAINANITNFKLIFNANLVTRGDGYLGEIYFAQIINKNTNKCTEVVIKMPFKNKQKREEFPIEIAYETEIHFYSKILPVLKKFELEKGVKEPFVETAKYYYGTLNKYSEALVLENLKAEGCIMKNFKESLDEEHLTLIFQTYAKFHALVFAFKDQNPEEYNSLVMNLKDLMALNRIKAKELINSVAKEAFEALKSNPEIYLKCLKYKTNASEELMKSMSYKGNKIITHGDSWANNLMYKYSKCGKLKTMKLIDFQAIREASPVHDLSYIFYSNGNKEQFKKLDTFLKIYYDSFSKYLQNLGSVPEELYSLERFKEDWKNYARFGVVLSLVVVKVQLMNSQDVKNLVDDKKTTLEGMLTSEINKDEFCAKTKDIILHAINIL